MSNPPKNRPPAVESSPKCAKCGACTAVCPVYRASGNEIYSARGKRHLAEVYQDRPHSPVFEDIYSKCLLCGACSSVCPRDLDIVREVVGARADFSLFYGEHGYQKFLARQALNRPELLGAARVLGAAAAELLFGRLPESSGLRLRLAMFKREELSRDSILVDDAPINSDTRAEPALIYYPGCAARYLYPEIMDQVRRLLRDGGYSLQTPSGLGCCGLATMAAGDLEGARRLARKNIAVLEQSEGPILTSCGSCYAQLLHYPELFAEDGHWRFRARLVGERVLELSRFVESLQLEETVELEDRGRLRVFYHDPCHLRHGNGITEEPRSLLRRLPEVELLELSDGPQCCGQGGLFHVGAPELAAAIRDDLAAKILELEPDLITTTCSGCIMQLKSAMAAAGSTVPVIHLAAVAAGRLRRAGKPAVQIESR